MVFHVVLSCFITFCLALGHQASLKHHGFKERDQIEATKSRTKCCTYIVAVMLDMFAIVKAGCMPLHLQWGFYGSMCCEVRPSFCSGVYDVFTDWDKLLSQTCFSPIGISVFWNSSDDWPSSIWLWTSAVLWLTELSPCHGVAQSTVSGGAGGWWWVAYHQTHEVQSECNLVKNHWLKQHSSILLSNIFYWSWWNSC